MADEKSDGAKFSDSTAARHPVEEQTRTTPEEIDPYRVPGHPEARVPGRVGPQTPDRVWANRECRDC